MNEYCVEKATKLERLYEDKIHLLEKERIVLRELVTKKTIRLYEKEQEYSKLEKSHQELIQENVDETEYDIADEYKIKCKTMSDIVNINDYYGNWKDDSLLDMFNAYKFEIYIYINNEEITGFDLSSSSGTRQCKEVTCREWKKSKGLL